MNEHVNERVAFVDRELDMLKRREEARKLAPASTRRKTGPSMVFSVRLDPAELAALESLALDTGVKTTVLARNLIRSGMAARQPAAVAAAVDRLQAACNELRSLVP